MIESAIPFPLQERSDEQIASATITVAMGGQVRRLPVLAIDPNERWTEQFTEAIGSQLGGVSGIETLADVSAALGRSTDVLIGLLVAYDASGVLGGREWMRAHATPGEVYEAFKQVTAAAFPFGVDLAKWAPEIRSLLLRALVDEASSRSTKPAPRRTGGRRARSATS